MTDRRIDRSCQSISSSTLFWKLESSWKLGFQVDAQVTYPTGSLDKIVANACGFPWNLMLLTARRTPQHLILPGVELKADCCASMKRRCPYTQTYLEKRPQLTYDMYHMYHISEYQYRRRKDVDGDRFFGRVILSPPCTAGTESVQGQGMFVHRRMT